MLRGHPLPPLQPPLRRVVSRVTAGGAVVSTSRIGNRTTLSVKLIIPLLLTTLAISIWLSFNVTFVAHSKSPASFQWDMDRDNNDSIMSQQYPKQQQQQQHKHQQQQIQHQLQNKQKQEQQKLVRHQTTEENKTDNKTSLFVFRKYKLIKTFWTNKTKLLPQVLHNGTCPGAETPLRRDRKLAPSVCSVYIHINPSDRSGANVFHLLDASAYAYYWGYYFAGACGESPHTADTQSLVTWLGLQHILPIDQHNMGCPEFDSPNETHYYDHVLRSKDFYRKPANYFKPNWLQFVKQNIHQHLQRTYPNETRGDHHDLSSPFSSSTTTTIDTSRVDDGQRHPRTIVVHIRRGDVMPCMPGWGRMRNTRFTPNQHYLNVIDHYAQPGDVVKIFSERVSYEPWDDFVERGYQLVLDGPLVDAWKAMIWDAHILITAQSSFSYVPALFSRAQVIVYTPQFRSSPQPGWVTVPDHIMNHTMRLREEILANCTYELETKYGNDQEAYMTHRKMYTYPNE